MFDSRDCDLQNVNLKEYLANYNINKPTDTQSKLLEGKLSVYELTQALKNMKKVKTPGIDGFPADFLKVFWSKLNFIIQRAINSSYDNNELPLTLRQCNNIMSAKSKQRSHSPKNSAANSIPLHSVIYNIASASIRNRLKTIFDFLIDKSQTGFITDKQGGKRYCGTYYTIRGILLHS